MQEAARLLREFSSGKTFADYQGDAMLRAAVEREFTIIGEAVARLASTDPAVASRISGHRRIIAFRNVLIHGYTVVDNQIVWDVLQNELPTLATEVEALLTPD
ncbi:MAG: DUF86 domain-containing protein [Chloroflexi bacterium]|nr:DUF86 domain-containing protein [Chloroflexota bacterium]